VLSTWLARFTRSGRHQYYALRLAGFTEQSLQHSFFLIRLASLLHGLGIMLRLFFFFLLGYIG